MAKKTGTNNNDVLTGSESADQLFGLEGVDVLLGNGGNDLLEGGLGDDYLDGGSGIDTLFGGHGSDTYVINNASDKIVEQETPEQQFDTVETYAQNYVLGKHLENLQLGYGNLIIKGTGNALNNQLSGNDANNILSGLTGNDTLFGGIGNDSLYGGAGNDTFDYYGVVGADLLSGGAGADHYWVDNVDDKLVETTVSNAPTEMDTVFARISFTLPANVENIELWNYEDSEKAVTADGNSSNNKMTGNSHDNLLSGFDGNDTLLGNEGADTLEGGNGYDRLNGGVGADVMSGGVGNDYYLVDNADDTVNELANSGNDTVESSLSNYTAGEYVENIVLLQDNWVINYIPQNAYGNALVNHLKGNSAANKLNGFAGNDWLEGMGGNDTLSGGLGNDTLVGGRWDNDTFVFDSELNAANNVDRIIDFETGSDTIRLENSVFSALPVSSDLNSGMFVSGENQMNANDANDFIIYNSTTGAVYYDADGSLGGSQPIQFIGVGVGLNLTAEDFAVI